MAWIAEQPLVIAIALLYVIVLLRAGATYAIGRGIGAGTRRSRLEKLTSKPSYVQACDLLARFGAPVVAVSFLTIGFQTVMNLAAGIAGMPLKRYVPALAVGGLAWATLYATIGVAALHLVAKSPWYGLAIVAVIAVCAFVAWRFQARARIGQ